MIVQYCSHDRPVSHDTSVHLFRLREYNILVGDAALWLSVAAKVQPWAKVGLKAELILGS